MRISIVVLLTIITSVSSAHAQKSNSLLPDLFFYLKCPGKERVVIEGEVEKFLKSQAFQVANMGKIRRDLGVASDSDILAIDATRRTIEVREDRERAQYVISLTTRPPTRRSSDLENKLLTFSRTRPGCNVQNVVRYENTVASSDFFDWEIKRITGLIREAEVCPKESAKEHPDRYLCPGWPRGVKPNQSVQPTQKSGAADANR